MRNKIKKFINSSIVITVAFIILGLIFIIFPEGSLDVIRWIIAIFCFVAGIYLLAANISAYRPMFGATILGVILMIGGIVFATNSNIMNILPIILGAWFIISSVSTLSYTAAIINPNARAWSTIASILEIVCGVLLIVNPWGGQIALMTFVGIMVLIYAVSSLIDLVTLKKNLQDINKKFDKLIEGEVVEEKKK